MRNLIIVLIVLLSLSIEGIAQDYLQFRTTPPPAIYLVVQPVDRGLGIRGDYHLNHWAGVYGSGSYGQWGLYQQSGLGQHVKLTAGVLIPWKDYKSNQYDFTLGLNYHWVSGEIIDSQVFKDNDRFHEPWSFEVGVTVKMPGFALGLRTDILRWEPCFDFGIPIRKKETAYQKCLRKGKRSR